MTYSYEQKLRNTTYYIHAVGKDRFVTASKTDPQKLDTVHLQHSSEQPNEDDEWKILHESGSQYTINSNTRDEFCSVPAGIKEGHAVTFDEEKYPWVIRLVHGKKDEFVILLPTNQYLGWTCVQSGYQSIKLTITKNHTTWKFSTPAPSVIPQLSRPSEPPTTHNEGQLPTKELIFGIDVGSFSSSVSFSVSGSPSPQSVMWKQTPDVRTLMYYENSDDSKPPKYYGAVPSPSEGFQLVDDFKARMNELSTFKNDQEKRDRLRRNYHHWLKFLFDDASTATRSRVDDRVWEKRRVVMAIPNDWKVDQSEVLRSVIRESGWVSDDSNVKFVGESEATVHCLLQNNELNKLKVGESFIILDAGLSNLDLALYRVHGTSPLTFKEESGKPAESVLGIGGDHGGQDALGGDWDEDDEDMDGQTLIENVNHDDPKETEFENKLKGFLSAHVVIVIAVGNSDLAKKLKSKVEGFVVDPPRIVQIARQNAAHGAIIWDLQQRVVAHAAPASYGTDILWPAPPNATKADLEKRKVKRFGGKSYFAYRWKPIVEYGEVSTGPIRHEVQLSREFKKQDEMPNVTVNIFVADDTVTKYWVCDKDGKVNEPDFRLIATINVDLSKLKDKVKRKDVRGKDGQTTQIYQIEFSVRITFQAANLKAYIIVDGEIRYDTHIVIPAASP